MTNYVSVYNAPFRIAVASIFLAFYLKEKDDYEYPEYGIAIYIQFAVTIVYNIAFGFRMYKHRSW